MKIETLAAEDVLLIEPTPVYSAGGFYCESYNAEQLAKWGVNNVFLQERSSLTAGSGTITGLHYQRPPFAQAKLVRAIRGAVFAVAVDLRKGSASFGQSVGTELTAENNRQLYTPEGFAVGYATLRPLTEIQCKSSKPFSVAHKDGIYWDDPALRIKWPISIDTAIISSEDHTWPLLREIETPFTMNTSEEDAAA